MDEVPVITYFFANTAATEIYTLSLHDALPIYARITRRRRRVREHEREPAPIRRPAKLAQLSGHVRDRKSTRLNSSHSQSSYAVFCLKKKKNFTDSINPI